MTKVKNLISVTHTSLSSIKSNNYITFARTKNKDKTAPADTPPSKSTEPFNKCTPEAAPAPLPDGGEPAAPETKQIHRVAPRHQLWTSRKTTL